MFGRASASCSSKGLHEQARELQLQLFGASQACGLGKNCKSPAEICHVLRRLQGASCPGRRCWLPGPGRKEKKKNSTLRRWWRNSIQSGFGARLTISRRALAAAGGLP